MRNFITLVEGLSDVTLYHGTSDLQWAAQGTGVLYLTASREDAANYADEAVVGDYTPEQLDNYHADIPKPSEAIVVEFKLSDIMSLHCELSPDWGWQELPEGGTWATSLDEVGSFCVEDFPHAAKALGKITPAF